MEFAQSGMMIYLKPVRNLVLRAGCALMVLLPSLVLRAKKRSKSDVSCADQHWRLSVPALSGCSEKVLRKGEGNG